VRDDLKLQQQRTKMGVSRLLRLYGISRSTFYGWDEAPFPKAPTRHNVLTVLPEEERAVVEFRQHHREIGYRKLTWLMNDADVAALSEPSVDKVLSKHNLLGPWQNQSAQPAQKEYQHKPTRVHEHWHTDIAYVKVKGVFYFLIMLLDGYSRYVLAWDLMTDMLHSTVEDFVQRARQKYPHGHPKLIHDNGSQFISRDFKILVSNLGIQQIFTRRNHPQTNGKSERLNGTVRQEALHIFCPGSYQEAWAIIESFVRAYNHQRLHAGIKYLRPADLFEGRAELILQKRRTRLQAARAVRTETNRLNFMKQRKEDHSKFLN